jgi:hypothetical protein
MYEEILATLAYFIKYHTDTFSKAFKHTGREIAIRDKEKIKTIFIHDGLVEEDPENSFGVEESYAITIYGKDFYKNVSEFRHLDSILQRLDNGHGSYADIETLCTRFGIPFSRGYEHRLLADQMITLAAASKDEHGTHYRLAENGKDMVRNRGGYVHLFLMALQGSVNEIKTEKQTSTMPAKPANQKKMTAFVSYSDFDKEKMMVLGDLISATDNLELIIIADYKQPMKALTDKVSEGLDAATFIIPILTDKSYKTQWINQEIGYAAAQKKTNFIYPLVESKIIGKLKGFIHSQVDLSYNFDATAIKEKDFTTVARELVKALSESVKTKKPPQSKVHILSDVFSGIWFNSHRSFDGRTGGETVQFKRDNQYWADGKHVFDLQDIFISEDLDIVTFTKVGVGLDRRQLVNKLQLNADGSYSGFEDGNTAIEYRKMDHIEPIPFVIDGGGVDGGTP